MIGSALIFNYIIATENVPTAIAQWIGASDFSPLAFLLMVNLIYLGLGFLLDATTVILVIVPLFIPACRELGIDLVHFGVVTVVNLMIGLITPPYGVLLFVINGTTKIPLAGIVKQVVPFIFVLLAALLVMILSPDLVLAIPRMMGYQG